MLRLPIGILLLLLTVVGCTETPEKDPLLSALSSEDERIATVMDSLAKYKVQILYTQIDRTKDSLIFTDYSFQVNDSQYFYPASTVKFPAAVAALEKLNGLDSLDRNTRFYVEGDSVETTIAKCIQEIFAVSDNAANNRLIEFLGQDDLNSRITLSGAGTIRIAHRLSTGNADDVTTKPLVIYINDSTTTTSEVIHNTPPKPLGILETLKGIGYYAGDSLVQEPFDFSLKNHYPIETQHNVLKRIMFPEQFEQQERFGLSEDQLDFLHTAMHTLPSAQGYDTETYYDSYVKFFLFGDNTEPMPKSIKIYNKVGYAYGTLTDCAYIQDTENNVDFLLTATILVNSDGIFNDDAYEYDEIGIPFLAQLGREIHQLEIERKKR
ncbi:MAG: serine hydrolase [Bacteroidota bacterium]